MAKPRAWRVAADCDALSPSLGSRATAERRMKLTGQHPGLVDDAVAKARER